MTKTLGSIELIDIEEGRFEGLVDGRPKAQRRADGGDGPAEVHVIADVETLRQDLESLFLQFSD